MSNLNVTALKRLFPKNTAHRKGGKANGANRKRVQVMLPPDTLARLDREIGYDEQARSAAVTLAVEFLCAAADEENSTDNLILVRNLLMVTNPKALLRFIGWVVMADYPPQP